MRNTTKLVAAGMILLTIGTGSAFASWTSSQTGSCSFDTLGYQGTFYPFLDWSRPIWGGSPGTIKGTWDVSSVGLSGWYFLTYTHTDTVGGEIQMVYQGTYGGDGAYAGHMITVFGGTCWLRKTRVSDTRTDWFGNWTNGNPYCDCGISNMGTMSGISIFTEPE